MPHSYLSLVTVIVFIHGRYTVKFNPMYASFSSLRTTFSCIFGLKSQIIRKVKYCRGA